MHYVMAKGILSAGGNINLYRGCTHGCIYCDSRSRCYHIDHAFEDVEVKQNAVELLEEALRRRRAPAYRAAVPGERLYCRVYCGGAGAGDPAGGAAGALRLWQYSFHAEQCVGHAGLLGQHERYGRHVRRLPVPDHLC